MSTTLMPTEFPYSCSHFVLKPQYLEDNCQKSISKKNTYYLEHSTDTTAIKSFEDASSITLWIALFATLLAWWFGKKSFNLTQQAFEQTIEQIKASIKVSSDNTEATLRSNQNLVNNQLIIQSNAFNFEREQDIKDDLTEISVLFFQSGKRIYFYLIKYTLGLSATSWRDFVNYTNLSVDTSIKTNQEFINIHNAINKEIENMLECLFKFSILSKHAHPKVEEAMENMKQATDLAIEQRNMHTCNDQEHHKQLLENLNTAIQNSRICMKDVIQDKNCFL
ncbi:hypothetical protein [Acinetobacter calcoaceticus]|uniref:hypothetical protein n=1 Tax=Acinetobacter calcoaceticus TaxID=471 RepID=UPI003A8988E8